MARKGLPKSIIKKYGITKEAWQVYRRGKTKSKRSNPSKSKTTRKRRNNPMAKRKRNRRSRNFTLPIALIGGVAAMPAVRGAVSNALSGNWKAIPDNLADIVKRPMPNLVPLFTGILVHYMARKLGINRALGQAGVPVIRI